MKICAVCHLCFEDSHGMCEICSGGLKDGHHSIDAIPGYRIEKLLSSTPNTRTFQGRHIEFGQECLVAIARRETKAFLSDAKIAASVFNTAIAGVIEYGELKDGSAFAILDGYCGRVPLRSLILESSLSLLDQIRIARQVAEATHAYHIAGLIHGGISAENVSVSGVGTDDISVKLHGIDLGSSIATGVLDNRFAMDSALETVRNFAPERFNGEDDLERSDVYSLGLLLYELLSGHPPFTGDSASDLIEMHLNQKPPEIKIQNFDLRMLLTHTLSEALQKKPSFRQATADLFARQMRHIEQLATHVPTPPPVIAVAAHVSAVRIPVAHQSPAKTPVTTVAAPAEIRPEPNLPVPASMAFPEPMVSHEVAMETAMPFTPSQPKRSRLKGIKKRLHSRVSEAKAIVSIAPTLIRSEQPTHDIPSMADARKEITGAECAIVSDTDDEITHVRPKERIEVNWSETATVQESEIAAEFFPKFTSAKYESGVKADSMFTEYHSQGRGVGRLPIYAVGAFAMILIGFGFFRLASALSDNPDGYIGEYRPTPLQKPAPAIQTEPLAEVTQSPAAVEVPVETVAIVARVEEPEAEREFKAPQVDPARIRALSVVSKEPTRPSPKASRTVVSEPTPIIAGQRSSGATPIVPSTLVITRGKEKPRETIVAGRPTQKGNVIVVGSATRPRIVSNPD